MKINGLEVTHVFTEPNKTCIVNFCHPQMEQEKIQEELKTLRINWPNTILMTWEEFDNQAYKLQNTELKMEEITEERYFELMECLPPAAMEHNKFLVGEPWDHCVKTGKPRFQMCVTSGGKHYASDRPVTKEEYKNWSI